MLKPFLPYRVEQPVPVEIIRPELWELTKSQGTSHSSTAVFERLDKGVMVAGLFLLTLSKKAGNIQNINDYVSVVLNFLETEGFALPAEVSTIKISSKRFLTGEYLSTSLLLGKDSYESWSVIWEAQDAFYALGAISVPRDVIPSVWMNARRIFALSSESLKPELYDSQ